MNDCDCNKTPKHWDGYVEPSEELKPAIELILRIGKDTEMKAIFKQLVKTKEFIVLKFNGINE